MWVVYLSAPGIVLDLVVSLSAEDMADWVALASSSPPVDPSNPFYVESSIVTLETLEVQLP